jgi:hypothetical protein
MIADIYIPIENIPETMLGNWSKVMLSFCQNWLHSILTVIIFGFIRRRMQVPWA